MIRLADLLNPFRSLHRAVTTWREQQLTAGVKRAKRAARAFPYDEHPRLSLIVQSFNHVRNVDQIMRGLRQAEVDYPLKRLKSPPPNPNPTGPVKSSFLSVTKSPPAR
jgi:hypothetical protein